MEIKQSATGLSAGLERAAGTGADLLAVSRTPARPWRKHSIPAQSPAQRHLIMQRVLAGKIGKRTECAVQVNVCTWQEIYF